jgi:hypothetical protein
MGAGSSVVRKVAFEEEADTEQLSPEARARKQAFEVAQRRLFHLPRHSLLGGFNVSPCRRRRGERPTTEARRRPHHDGPMQRRKVASRAERYPPW